MMRMMHQRYSPAPLGRPAQVVMVERIVHERDHAALPRVEVRIRLHFTPYATRMTADRAGESANEDFTHNQTRNIIMPFENRGFQSIT